jgi:hypothetical protein
VTSSRCRCGALAAPSARTATTARQHVTRRDPPRPPTRRYRRRQDRGPQRLARRRRPMFIAGVSSGWMAARHAGPEATGLLGTYFASGDLDELRRLVEAAGLQIADRRRRSSRPSAAMPRPGSPTCACVSWATTSSPSSSASPVRSCPPCAKVRRGGPRYGPPTPTRSERPGTPRSLARLAGLTSERACTCRRAVASWRAPAFSPGAAGASRGTTCA